MVQRIEVPNGKSMLFVATELRSGLLTPLG
jgi:hypothetical protein